MFQKMTVKELKNKLDQYDDCDIIAVDFDYNDVSRKVSITIKPIGTIGTNGYGTIPTPVVKQLRRGHFYGVGKRIGISKNSGKIK